MRLWLNIINIAIVAVFTTAAASAALASTLITEATKADFFKYLATKQQIVMCFYDDSSDESAKVVRDFEKFAAFAAQSYPDMQLCTVNHKDSPYLTARLLLKAIPEVRLLIKDKEGEWSAYTYDTDEGMSGIADYIDNQRWHGQLPSDSLAHALCSPFNFCGKALAVFAEASIAFERVLPIPRWLALLLIPSFMAFVGRFIIDWMYAAEDRVRSTLSTQQPEDTAVIDKKAQ